MRRAAAAVGLAVGLALPLPAVLLGYGALRGSQDHVEASTGQLQTCPGAVVIVTDGDPVSCDVQPGQQLDVIYPAATAEDDAGDACDRAGGRLVDDPVHRFRCQDVDK